MNDDIKTRLEAQANGLHEGTLSHFDDTFKVLLEAADFIEDLEQRIAALSEELDNERVRLAACGVAAMCNTRQSMTEQRITKDNPYYSASYEDVCKAVDREVSYRERLESAHPAPSQPSAESLVAAALEAAALACDGIEEDYIKAEYHTWAEMKTPADIGARECASCIRALDKQKIIDGAGK